MLLQPERLSRIDNLLKAAGCQVFDSKDPHILTARGVAIREFPFDFRCGFRDGCQKPPFDLGRNQSIVQHPAA
jgi:hypothetical protein